MNIECDGTYVITGGGGAIAGHIARTFRDAGARAQIEGDIDHSAIVRGRRAMLVVSMSDGTGRMTLRFFHFSAAQKNRLQPGTRLRCFGQVRRGGSSRHSSSRSCHAPMMPDAVIAAVTEKGKGYKGISSFVVDLDHTPGFKVGMRSTPIPAAAQFSIAFTLRSNRSLPRVYRYTSSVTPSNCR